MRWLLLSPLALLLSAMPANAAGINGQYLEARTCEVFTGPCFANADTGLVGRHGVMAWKVDRGAFENVSLDGLSVVAVVAASDTLGLKQTGEGRAILILDRRANPAQRQALIRLAKRQGGELIRNVIAVETASIAFDTCTCKEGGCARLSAGPATIETRCIDAKHDKTCGNEWALYPPLARDLQQTRAAVAVEHSFTGKAFNETWKDGERRGAYLATFVVR